MNSVQLFLHVSLVVINAREINAAAVAPRTVLEQMLVNCRTLLQLCVQSIDAFFKMKIRVKNDARQLSASITLSTTDDFGAKKVCLCSTVACLPVYIGQVEVRFDVDRVRPQRGLKVTLGLVCVRQQCAQIVVCALVCRPQSAVNAKIHKC